MFFLVPLFFNFMEKNVFRRKKSWALFSDVLIKRPISRLIREPFICSFADRREREGERERERRRERERERGREREREREGRKLLESLIPPRTKNLEEKTDLAFVKKIKVLTDWSTLKLLCHLLMLSAVLFMAYSTYFLLTNNVAIKL